MAELWERDAWELADEVRAGTLKARELVEAHLDRIERYNPDLNAFYFVDAEGARARADEIDARVAEGDDPGALAALPIGVKDTVDVVAGTPSPHGSRLYEGRVSDHDSVHVGRLRRAGAVIVGRTNAPEFGAQQWTDSLVHGPARNPWNRERTPGGSSGGSAAAVAGGLVPVASGGDGGGSIRIPAAFAGLLGMKGTFGRIPAGPEPIDVALTVCLGCLARSVRDSARWFDVASGPDVYDFTSLPPPAHSYEDLVVSGRAAEGLRGKRAVWSSTLGFAVCDPAVEEVAREAAEALVEEAGLELLDVPVELPVSFTTWALIASLDLCWHAKAAWSRPDDLTPVVGMAMQMLEHLKPRQLFAAYRGRHELLTACADLFSRVDLLLTPTTAVTAFAAEGPPPFEVAGQPVGPGGDVPYTMPFNLSGQPAASIPAGFVDGLPVGLQVVARRLEDELCFGAAAVLEAARPWPKVAPRRGRSTT